MVPPKNPSRSLPPDPDFLQSGYCEGARDSRACNELVLAAVKHARAVLEALGPMSFSLATYLKLPKVEQLFVTVNLERIDRGVAPVAYLTKSLVSGKRAIYGDSETEIIVGVCGPRLTDVVASWATLKARLHAK
jgi:hypothetical protein